MKKVLLRAPLLTNSGYGVHSRQVFTWLYSKKDIELTVECLQWGRTAWLLNGEHENGLIGKIMECSREIKTGDYDISFQVQLPDEWDSKLAKINVGITAAVETDKCTQKWVEACNKMDHIIVPSTFTKNVIKRSGLLKKPITVIQEWYNTSIGNKSKISKTLNDDRYEKIQQDFNILTIGTLTSTNSVDDRKNLINTIKWICEEFSENEEVGIVLKTSLGKGTTIDKMMCTEAVENIVKQYRKGNFPKISFVHGNMTSEEINALYAHPKVKIYASATRGEGYGLPLIEAAASGLPIVVTGWSGHLEFLNKDLVNLVDYDLVEISETRVDDRVFEKGFRWANPREESFKKQIRHVYENYHESREKAKQLKKIIWENFNSAKIKNSYEEVFRRLMEK